MLKVLLDTDIGSDIDDAVCLAYLLAHPECDLAGITTVSGESVKRAQLASVLCIAARKQVPIFPGVESPLLTAQKQPDAKQAAALGKWDHQTDFPQGQAIAFLRDTIRSSPGEIVLLAIGPLTNIALLFAMDPEIPSLLKGLVMMCGVFTSRAAEVGPLEWNASCDPYATAVVYRHAAPVHRSVGLDVTCRVEMLADEVRHRFHTPLLRPVLDFAEIWFRDSDRITFHDPLAAATLFDDRICRFEKGTVEVELERGSARGMTRWNKTGTKHEIAVDVNADIFFDEFFSVVGTSSL